MAPVWVPDFSPLQLSAGRYLAYGLGAAAFLAPRWREVLPRVSRNEWWALIWLSLLGNILYYVLLASAVQMGGVAMTTLITGFMPVAVTVIGVLHYRNLPLRRLMPSLLLGLGGVLCSVWPALQTAQPDGLPHPLLGALCALGALAVWSAYAAANAIWIKRLHHVSARDWSLLLGLVTGAEALLLLVPALQQSLDHPPAAWFRFGAVCAGIALFASVIGNALWNRMSRLLPLTMTGQMILCEMLFALLYCFVWEQRWPLPGEAAALVLLIASVMLCVSSHRAATASSTTEKAQARHN